MTQPLCARPATTELTQSARAPQSPRARGHITATTHARGTAHIPAQPYLAQGAQERSRAKNARGATLTRAR